MKAIQSIKFSFFAGVLFSALFLFTSAAFAEDPNNVSIDSISKRLTAIEKKLSDIEKREQQILDGQAKILEEVLRNRIWLSHR